MENKGLNIFNSQCVLASPDTATDYLYGGLESPHRLSTTECADLTTSRWVQRGFRALLRTSISITGLEIVSGYIRPSRFFHYCLSPPSAFVAAVLLQ